MFLIPVQNQNTERSGSKKQGFELSATELEPVLSTLSQPYAAAIEQRVKALNKTVRGRTKCRSKRKPDIRDVFRDFDESSTGTRSRSATPDSLDSIQVDEVWRNSLMPNVVRVFENNSEANIKTIQQSKGTHLKQKLHRTPSVPLKSSTSADIFRGSHVRCDIPLYSAHGVELLGYSRIGTIHLPRNRSGSDPSCSVGRDGGTFIRESQSENNTSSGDSSDEYMSKSKIKDQKEQSQLESQCSKSHPPQQRDGPSFESYYRDTLSPDGVEKIDSYETSLKLFSDIVLISEIDLKHLQKTLWLELATIFDRNQVSLDKRKPFKRRRKEEGNLFGVSLNALIRRDQQVTGTDSTLVPIFLENLLTELLRRGSREEGILRIAGHKQKTESLYNEFETIFYQKTDKISHLFSAATIHELSALLKRWLRELPQPLLTNELIKLFYQCHKLSKMDQRCALSILCQLLPHENRNTFRSLLQFLNNIIDLKDFNKMNLHNVSTIIAPSFFPPRYIHPIDKKNIEEQVKMAADCCRLTNVMILLGERLFQVPKNLIMESRCKTTKMGKKGPSRSVILVSSREEKSAETGSPTAAVINAHSTNSNHVHRLVV
ncbi:rho GTPase-activating protein conundrum isoform X2 [Drosophila kikkawai]|uniref:Rho GTPase-activating protein conundrum isoform X2 n=1 Tax=Drosophila kikkawai TaxID=30033 RepID=A0ABM4GAU0_DROKI